MTELLFLRSHRRTKGSYPFARPAAPVVYGALAGTQRNTTVSREALSTIVVNVDPAAVKCVTCVAIDALALKSATGTASAASEPVPETEGKSYSYRLYVVPSVRPLTVACKTKFFIHAEGGRFVQLCP